MYQVPQNRDPKYPIIIGLYMYSLYNMNRLISKPNARMASPQERVEPLQDLSQRRILLNERSKNSLYPCPHPKRSFVHRSRKTKLCPVTLDTFNDTLVGLLTCCIKRFVDSKTAGNATHWKCVDVVPSEGKDAVFPRFMS